jgi:Ferritin-like domain
VALPGMHKYFRDASDEEREHAQKLMKYMNQRGGRIVLQDVKAPGLDEEMTAVDAMTKALELEKTVNEVRRKHFKNRCFDVLSIVFRVFWKFMALLRCTVMPTCVIF